MGTPWSMIGQGIASGVQNVVGVYQYEKGKREDARNIRPDYQIPDEIKNNLTQAQMMALEGLPAEQKQQYIQNLQRSANFSMNAISSRKGGLAGLAGAQQQQNDAYGNLLSADANARMQNQKQAMQAGDVMAQYKDQQFKLNKLNPYYELKAKDEALMGAGIKNIVGAHQNMANSMGSSGSQSDSSGGEAKQSAGSSSVQGQSAGGDYENMNQYAGMS